LKKNTLALSDNWEDIGRQLIDIIVRYFEIVTDAVICIHWLRVFERIKYTVAVLAYKIIQIIHDIAPRYLGLCLFVHLANVPGR